MPRSVPHSKAFRRAAHAELKVADRDMREDKLIKRLTKAAKAWMPGEPRAARSAAAEGAVAAVLADGSVARSAGGRLAWVGSKRAAKSADDDAPGGGGAKRRRTAGGDGVASGTDNVGPSPGAAPPPTSAAAPASTPSPAKPAKRLKAAARRPAAAPSVPSTSAPLAPPPATAAADDSWRALAKRTDVKKGRLSAAEKEALKAAVGAVAASRGLPADDHTWLFATRTGPHKKEAAGAWKEIAAALPGRSVKAVYAAGTRMLHPGNHRGPWSADDAARLLELVATKGPKWAEIGGALGRLPEACRDRWREARLGGEKARGRWNGAEEAALVAAVQADLARKAAPGWEEGVVGGSGCMGVAPAPAGAAGEGAAAGPTSTAAASSDAALPTPRPPPRLPSASALAPALGGRAALDGVDWGLVSAAVRTRSPVQCLEKWYDQLSPSMVERGDWGAGDDRRLLRAVLASGADAEWQVDWGGAVAGRCGAAARRRWRLMVKHVTSASDLGVADVAARLAARYAPGLLKRGKGGAEGNGGAAA